MNPKKLQAAMKQMGINQEDIPAERVIIEQTDKRLIIENPHIVKINMQGQESFQITGDIHEEAGENTTSEDIQTLIEKTGISEEKARETLEAAHGDLTEALLNLSK